MFSGFFLYHFLSHFKGGWEKVRGKNCNNLEAFIYSVYVYIYNYIYEKRSERQRRKGKIFPFKCRVQKNSKESSESLKEIEENNRMGKTRDLFKEIRDTFKEIREHFMHRWAQ